MRARAVVCGRVRAARTATGSVLEWRAACTARVYTARSPPGCCTFAARRLGNIQEALRVRPTELKFMIYKFAFYKVTVDFTLIDSIIILYSWFICHFMCTYVDMYTCFCIG